MGLVDEFNGDFKEQYESYKSYFRKILIHIIKVFPREEIIKVLKERKIIKYEYVDSTGKLELVENK